MWLAGVLLEHLGQIASPSWAFVVFFFIEGTIGTGCVSSAFGGLGGGDCHGWFAGCQLRIFESHCVKNTMVIRLHLDNMTRKLPPFLGKTFEVVLSWEV